MLGGFRSDSAPPRGVVDPKALDPGESRRGTVRDDPYPPLISPCVDEDEGELSTLRGMWRRCTSCLASPGAFYAPVAPHVPPYGVPSIASPPGSSPDSPLWDPTTSSTYAKTVPCSPVEPREGPTSTRSAREWAGDLRDRARRRPTGPQKDLLQGQVALRARDGTDLVVRRGLEDDEITGVTSPETHSISCCAGSVTPMVTGFF